MSLHLGALNIQRTKPEELFAPLLSNQLLWIDDACNCQIY